MLFPSQLRHTVAFSRATISHYPEPEQPVRLPGSKYSVRLLSCVKFFPRLLELCTRIRKAGVRINTDGAQREWNNSHVI